LLPTAVPVTTATPSSDPRQPNVLLITIDTVRSDRVGAYGFENAHTPTLDRLATEGARFDRAVCQLPQTNASHAALLTGLYPSTSGVKVHMVDRLSPGSQTMASVFRDAGYQTAGIYSWVSLDPQFCGLDQGFQTYAGYVLNRTALFSDPRLEGLLAVYRQVKSKVAVVQTADAVLQGSDQVEKTLDGRGDVTTAAALQWLDQHVASGPFFLWLHYFDPHYPYTPPAGFDHLLGLNYHGKIDGSVDVLHGIEKGNVAVDNADRARLGELYQGEIAFADAQIGRLLDDLRRRGLEDDTIVVAASDHGESFGEHGDWIHGLKVFETEVHVPLIVRYPRRVPAGRAVTAAVQLIDVMPTVLDLAGLHPKHPVQGTSFLPLLDGKAASNGTDPADRIGFTELADEAFVALVTAEWKLIRNDANGELQLYHVSQDEAEAHNLADDQPRVTRELSARLQDVMKLSGVSK